RTSLDLLGTTTIRLRRAGHRSVRDGSFAGVFGAETSAALRRSKSATPPLFPSRVRPCSRGEGPGVDLGAFLWSFSEDEVGGCLAALGAHRSEVARLDVGPGRRNVREVLQSVLGDLDAYRFRRDVLQRRLADPRRLERCSIAAVDPLEGGDALGLRLAGAVDDPVGDLARLLVEHPALKRGREVLDRAEI